MENVRLRANIIIGGAFLKYGSIVDLERIPARLRKRKYILREGGVDPDAKVEELAATIEEDEAYKPRSSKLRMF
jgi:hypothetical protein